MCENVNHPTGWIGVMDARMKSCGLFVKWNETRVVMQRVRVIGCNFFVNCRNVTYMPAIELTFTAGAFPFKDFIIK